MNNNIHSHEHTHTHSHEHSHDHDHNHEHSHDHDHELSHTETAGEANSNKLITLMDYMLSHNIQHTEELEKMCEKLEKEGFKEGSALIKECVSDYQNGNEKLREALHKIKTN